MRNNPDRSRLSKQLALFANGLPDGLRYEAEFISPAAEIELIERFARLPLVPFQFGQYEGKRKVISFGFTYDFTLRQLKQAEPIPDWLGPFLRKVEAFGGPGTRVRQILLTEYQTGVGIGWHRDKPQFETIFGLSLGSHCKLRFRRPLGTRWQRFALEASPRSLYEMSREVRHVWEHSIAGVEAPRYSITFRTMAESASGASAT